VLPVARGRPRPTDLIGHGFSPAARTLLSTQRDEPRSTGRSPRTSFPKNLVQSLSQPSSLQAHDSMAEIKSGPLHLQKRRLLALFQKWMPCAHRNSGWEKTQACGSVLLRVRIPWPPSRQAAQKCSQRRKPWGGKLETLKPGGAKESFLYAPHWFGDNRLDERH
jgi:hypothetical protein